MSTIRIHGVDYIQVPCIQVKQPVGIFYIAAIGYKDLLEISYADVRHLEENSTELEKYIGIQRLLSANRVKEIANYVTLVDATFPTGVIVQINEYASITTASGEETPITYRDGDIEQQLPNVIFDADSKILKIRKDEHVAKVLDGQHRLAGLRDGALTDLTNDSFELNVTIFVDMDIEDQAIVFSTINKSQAKVNKSLVADLFEYSKTRSPQKTSHNIARALNQKIESPFYKKINILGQAKDKSETITQATFVDYVIKYISGNNLRAMHDRDLYKRGNKPQKVFGVDQKRLFLRNLFIDEKDSEIAQLIWNYFSVVQEKWPTAWNDTQTGMILNRSTGFIALMKFLKPVYLSFEKADTVITKNDFLEIFNRINIPEVNFTRENYLPGTSGQSKLLNELSEKSGIAL